MSTAGHDTDRHAIAEELERRCHQDLYYAAPESVRRAMGWRCEAVGGALVSVAGDTPSILINRTIGLGGAQPATPEVVAEICRLYAEAGVERYFIHVGQHADPPRLRDWLAAHGLTPQRRWMKFERDARPAPPARAKLEIARVEAPHGDAFGRIVADGFDLGEPAAELFPPLVGRPGWHLFGAFAEDELAATGALFTQGECGYLTFGATRPAHRRQGGQGALLAARIEAARALGCTLLCTETGEDVPGDPQHSYRNIERAGFVPAYLRDNYAPPR